MQGQRLGAMIFSISKHPMLKFIPVFQFRASSALLISKHPMLKFIKNSAIKSKHDNDFKTSHVKVYLSAYTPMMCRHRHFKTSHVKVYHRGDSKNSKSEVISKHPMLKFIENRNSTALVQTNFKTSHVKVYRETAT